MAPAPDDLGRGLRESLRSVQLDLGWAIRTAEVAIRRIRGGAY